MGLTIKCCTTLTFDCAVSFPPSFSLFFHSLDFLFNPFKQRETFGEAGQKPELSSREATAVSAVASTSLTSNRAILPNIDITKLGFHLFCTSLLCCWKSNQPPTTSRSGLWVSVDSIDLLAALIFCFRWPMCLVGTFYQLFRSCVLTKIRINSRGGLMFPQTRELAVMVSQRVWPQLQTAPKYF